MPERPVSNRYLGATAGEAARIMTEALARGHIDTPSIDARLLVTAALQVSKQDLILNPTRLVAPDEAEKLVGFEVRRLAHEPVSRILGVREFYGRTFEISPATLDPRPDSEVLIDAALEIARARGWRNTPIRILDIGTGTGCLLLTLLAELPLATGIGTDISAAALDVARGNAARLGLSGRVDWHQTNLADGLSGHFDLIVSNPPYIPTATLAELGPDVRLYDPLAALDGGPDGLAFYREIASGMARRTSFSALLFEVGAGQAPDVAAILGKCAPGLNGEVKSWQDLGGHTRCVALATH